MASVSAGLPNDFNITRTVVSASCKAVSNQQFQYYTWAEGCPAYSKAQAYNFLKSRNAFQETLPTCQMPNNPTPPLGETLSQPIPAGYEVANEQVNTTTTQNYDAYGAVSSSANISPNVNGIRSNASIVTGYCYGLSAGITFRSNVYNGVLTTETSTLQLHRLCNEKDTKYKYATNQQPILKEWTDEDVNLTQRCIDLNGSVVHKRVACKSYHSCVKTTDACPIEQNENINSYVSPRDNTFHEDIPLDGVGFGLHYDSAEWNTTEVAHGWHLSVDAKLEGDRLYFGSGSARMVEERYVEGNLTVVNTGSSEMLFNAQGNVVQTRDLYTKEVMRSFGYDATGELESISDVYGETSTVQRDVDGRVTGVVAPTGQQTLLSIDSNGDLIEVQYEDGASYAFEYERHLMTVETEPKGNRFLHFFDDSGKVVKVIDAEQAQWLFGSNTAESYGSHTVTRASGDVIVYKNHFLENNTTLRTEKLLPTGDVVEYSNSIDDSMSSTKSCGMTTTNLYKTNPDGSLFKDVYTAKRVLESSTVVTPSGLTNTTLFTKAYTLKQDGTLKRIVNTSTTNAKTSTQIKNFKRHRDISISPLGKRTHIQYDPQMKQPLEVKPYGLYKTTYTYNPQGRVIQETTGNRTTTYTYDAKGNLATITDPLQHTTSYIYDSRDRRIQTTYADGSTEYFDYDANSNPIKRTVPTPADHTFSYNGVNKRTLYTSPEQKQTTYTYDKQRRVIQVTKPSSKTIDTTYTNARVTSIQTDEGTTNYSYACQSNISQISKGSESFSFTYDGTLLTSISQTGQLNQSIDYTYNNDFTPISMTYAGQTENYTYNDDNEPTQIGTYTITRKQKNRKIILSDGNYRQVTKINRYGELKKQKDNTIEIELKRNPLGEIVKKEEKLFFKEKENKKEEKGSHHKKKKKHHKEKNKKESHHKKSSKDKKGSKDKKAYKNTYRYTYDTRGRLTKVRKNHKTVESYTYDSNGNRQSATVNNQTITASYTLDDNLVVYGDNTYLYDDDGYLTEKTTPNGTTTYSYGTLGELLEVTTPTKTITYKHNANNQRVAKLVNGTVVEKYLWADLTTLLATYDANDTLKQRFEYVNGRMPVAMTDANNTKYYLHYDQVGSLRAISRVLSPDNTLEVVKEITYDTFGNILTDTNPTLSVPFGFAGGLYDADTKLTRFGYRDYDAYVGKWTAKDPIGFAGGDSNLYGYVLGNPVGFVDSDGLSFKDMLAKAILTIGRNRVDSLLSTARLYKTQGKQKLYNKLGDFDTTLNDLKKLSSGKYSTKFDKNGNQLCIAKLDDGRTAIARSFSKDGRATLEIQSKNFKHKIRYQKWMLPQGGITPLLGLFF